MMNNTSQGWICLYRSMLEWEWYGDIKVKAVYLHCLLKANHTQGRWQGYVLERGEFITSLSHMAKELSMGVREVRTALDKLEKTGEIERKATSRYTLIKCCHYSLFQDISPSERHSPDKAATQSRQADDKLPTTNNHKNKNNHNNHQNKPLRRKPSFDVEEIKRRAMFDDDYDI